jgi:hypothetical protein
MKKFKGIFSHPSHMESSAYEDQRASFKHQSLMQDYQQLLKETETKKKKMEMMKQKKLTLTAEVRFLKQRYQQLTQIKSSKPEPSQISIQLVTSKKYIKGRNYHGKNLGLPPPVPRFDSSKKGKIYHGKEIALQNPSLTFDLNQKQRFSKETASPSFFPVFDLNQKERVHSRKDDTSCSRTPVFDLNQISREVEEELQANGEPERLEDLKKSEQLNEMMLAAACRTIGNGANRTGKRKISWQDQVALRV